MTRREVLAMPAALAETAGAAFKNTFREFQRHMAIDLMKQLGVSYVSIKDTRRLQDCGRRETIEVDRRAAGNPHGNRARARDTALHEKERGPNRIAGGERRGCRKTPRVRNRAGAADAPTKVSRAEDGFGGYILKAQLPGGIEEGCWREHLELEIVRQRNRGADRQRGVENSLRSHHQPATGRTKVQEIGAVRGAGTEVEARDRSAAARKQPALP